MTYTVSITSQGQLSIPANVRRFLGLDRGQKANLRVEGSKIVIEKVPDIMDLAGIFRTKRKVSKRDIREGFAKYMASRHLHRGNFPFPHVSPK